jgi:hypothetical protein
MLLKNWLRRKPDTSDLPKLFREKAAFYAERRSVPVELIVQEMEQHPAYPRPEKHGLREWDRMVRLFLETY